MFERSIEAPASIAVSLLVNYTRDRRSAELERGTVINDRSARRVHEQAWTRLTEAMNHLAIKAMRAGIDMEVLSWVVQAATDRQLETLACEEINSNDHMVKLIEQMRTTRPQLKFKGVTVKIDGKTVVKTSAKPRKAPVLKHSEAYYAQVAKGLANATSRDQAAELLDDGLTINDLNHLWTLAGRDDRIPSKLRKAERRAHLIENLVGYRLDSEVIRTGAMA